MMTGRHAQRRDQEQGGGGVKWGVPLVLLSPSYKSTFKSGRRRAGEIDPGRKGTVGSSAYPSVELESQRMVL